MKRECFTLRPEDKRSCAITRSSARLTRRPATIAAPPLRGDIIGVQGDDELAFVYCSAACADEMQARLLARRGRVHLDRARRGTRARSACRDRARHRNIAARVGFDAPPGSERRRPDEPAERSGPGTRATARRALARTTPAGGSNRGS
jgi:hypothetical protein